MTFSLVKPTLTKIFVGSIPGCHEERKLWRGKGGRILGFAFCRLRGMQVAAWGMVVRLDATVAEHRLILNSDLATAAFANPQVPA